MGKKKSRRPKGFSWTRFIFVWVPVFFAINWAYHALKKPSEVLGIVDSQFYNSPRETWQEHGDSFRRFSTSIITADFLAGLAQAETQGNPIARTYWRWKWSLNPFEVYSPASSAVGMFQITDGTFENLKSYCIRKGRPSDQGCGSFVKSRLVPAHSIEMTSAYLHLAVEKLVGSRGSRASRLEKQSLAAVIHLCGEGGGQTFVRSGFRSGHQRCGDHRVSQYLVKLRNYQQVFRTML